MGTQRERERGGESERESALPDAIAQPYIAYPQVYSTPMSMPELRITHKYTEQRKFINIAKEK